MDINVWINIGVTVGLFILGGINVRQQKTQDRLHERLDKNDDTTRKQESRIGTLEEQIKHVPTAESIGKMQEKLYDKLNELSLRVANMAGSQDTIHDMLSRILKEEGTNFRQGKR